MIILTHFTNQQNPGNESTSTKSSQHQQNRVTTLVVWSKLNVTGNNHFKQVIICINRFHLTFLIKTNTFLIDSRRGRYLLSYNLWYVKLTLSVKSSSYPLKIRSLLKYRIFSAPLFKKCLYIFRSPPSRQIFNCTWRLLGSNICGNKPNYCFQKVMHSFFWTRS